MNIKWSFEKEDQISYYIQQAKRVQNGFFQRIRAVVLPRLHPDGWYLPDYDLFENKEFVDKIKKVDDEIFSAEDKRLIEIIEDKFDLYVTENEAANERQKFEEQQGEFFALCEEFFPIYKNISSITIIPTKFGTGSSFYVIKEDDSYSFILTFRLDKGYVFAFRSFLSRLADLSIQVDDEKPNDWRLLMGIADFIAFDTVFKKFFENTNLNRTILFMDDYKGELLEESAQYFAKMGYPLRSSFDYDNETILFNGKPVVGLTNKEIDVMKLLIDHKSKIVSFDEVGDVYWGDDPDKFSLEAIAKVIEKLRNNLEKNGINESFIRTVRKRGYLLFD